MNSTSNRPHQQRSLMISLDLELSKLQELMREFQEHHRYYARWSFTPMYQSGQQQLSCDAWQ
jgi:hypothetical protein